MALKTGTYQRKEYFDFAKAVKQAREDFPSETRYTSFIDLDSPQADQQMMQWVQSLDRDSQEILFASGALDALDRDTAGVTLFAPNGATLVAVHSTYNEGSPFFPGDPLRQAAFAFTHELGHVVAKSKTRSIFSNSNEAEIAADTFAAIRGFQTGLLDKQDVKHIADMRLGEALLSGGFDHMTTMAMDALIINPKNTDFLSLSPAQIKKVAEQHAEACSNDRGGERSLKSIFNSRSFYGLTKETMLQNMARLALDADKDSKEFYIAARAILPAMEKSNPGRLARALGLSGDKLQTLYNRISSKAEGRDIGAEEALKNPSLEVQPQGFFARIGNWFKPLAI